MNVEKQGATKRTWAKLSERARLGEKFGFIACLGLLYKSGQISREQVLEGLRARGVSKEDMQKFREHREVKSG